MVGHLPLEQSILVRVQVPQQMKILITGIPGMGKTTLGDKLRDKYGYQHLDMESHPAEHNLLCTDPKAFITNVVSSSKDFVITYGFYPPHYTPVILFLRESGFKLIWLDGDRNSALREFKRREMKNPQTYERAIESFDKQIARIEKTSVIEEIQPAIINNFDQEGNFRNEDDVIKEILS